MLVEGKVLRKDEHNQFFGRIDDALRCSHAAPAEGAQCSQSPGQTVVDSNGDSRFDTTQRTHLAPGFTLVIRFNCFRPVHNLET